MRSLEYMSHHPSCRTEGAIGSRLRSSVKGCPMGLLIDSYFQVIPVDIHRGSYRYFIVSENIVRKKKNIPGAGKAKYWLFIGAGDWLL